MNRAFVFGAAAAAVVSGASCVGSINGEVDGDSVPSFTTAALGVVEMPDSDAVTLFAYFATAGDACSLVTQHFEIMQDEDDPEDEAEKIVELYEESTPEEMWFATLIVTADDVDDLEEETELDLEDFDEDVRGFFSVCRREGWPEEDNGIIEWDDDCFGAEDGVLKVQYAEEDALSVSTEKEMDLVDDDDDDAGEITFSGRARYCESWSDIVQDGVDDSQPPPGEGEGEGEGEGVCSFSSDCQMQQMNNGGCVDNFDCFSDERCAEDSLGSGWCLTAVDDDLTCDDMGLERTFLADVEGSSFSTCVSFDTFCDGDTCVF